MIPQFTVLVVLLCVVSRGQAACQDKPSMDNYSPDLISGKFYLIILKPAFDQLNPQLRCGTSYIKSAATENFEYDMTYQDSNGTIHTVSLNIRNISPPGTFHATSADGSLDFEASVLGAIKDKVHIFYACNAKNEEEAVWVYYYKRVNGVGEMDNASRQYTGKILAENHISINGFKVVNNKNCK